MKYCCLGVFKKEYFRNILGSKNKKQLRGSTHATIHPLAIILTMAVQALVSIIVQGSIVASYCLLWLLILVFNSKFKPGKWAT